MHDILIPMRCSGPRPFRGRVIGSPSIKVAASPVRQLPLPRTATSEVLAAAVFTADSGLASFALRVPDRSAWSSTADGGCLIVEIEWPHMIERGVGVVVTEGPRPVA